MFLFAACCLKKELTYVRWNSLLEARFEKLFFIPQNPKLDHEHFVDASKIRQRGIYKDTYKVSMKFESRKSN